MVVDYQLGKIYKLTSPSNNLVYYGSTAQQHLSTRIADHVRDYKQYLNNKGAYTYSFKVLECDDYKYDVIEEYPCNNVQQLKTRERWYIQNNECVNKNIPGRTTPEWREDNKEYLKQHSKEYNSEKISCECGCQIGRCDLARHKKTKKHIRLMELLQNN